jgi:hypothetical protein
MSNYISLFNETDGNFNNITVDGTVDLTDADVLVGTIQFADGSATAPSITFSADTNTGIYRNSSDILSITSGGIESLRIKNDKILPYAPIQNVDGSASAPSVTFQTATDLGLYKNSANTVSVASSGTEVMRFNNSLNQMYVPLSMGTNTLNCGNITCDSINGGTDSAIVGALSATSIACSGTMSCSPNQLSCGPLSVFGTISSSGSCSLGGTLSCPSISCGPISSGAITCAGTLSCTGITSTGAYNSGTNSMNCGAITSNRNFTNGVNSITTGSISCLAISSAGSFTNGFNSMTTGNITCSSVNSSGTISATNLSFSGNITGAGSIAISGSISNGSSPLTTGAVTCGDISCNTINSATGGMIFQRESSIGRAVLPQGLVIRAFNFGGGLYSTKSDIDNLFTGNTILYSAPTAANTILDSGANFTLPTGLSNTFFCYEISGYINSPGQLLTFQLKADDGCDLFIDNLYMGGEYGTGSFGGARTFTTTPITLTQGYHRILFRFYNVTGGYQYQLYWDQSGVMAQISYLNLYYDPTDELFAPSITSISTGSVNLVCPSISTGTGSSSFGQISCTSLVDSGTLSCTNMTCSALNSAGITCTSLTNSGTMSCTNFTASAINSAGITCTSLTSSGTASCTNFTASAINSAGITCTSLTSSGGTISCGSSSVTCGSIKSAAPLQLWPNSSTVSQLTLSNTSASSMMSLDASKNLVTTQLTNGQLLIGSTSNNPVAAALTGTTNQVNVTNGAGSITLATPQNIHTGATPTFAGAYLNGVTVVGNSSLISTGTGKLQLYGTTNASTSPDISIITSEDNYPAYHQLNSAHNNIVQSYDAYWDGSTYRSSNSSSNYQIGKVSNQLRFIYGAGTSQGSIPTLLVAGYFNSSGNFVLNGNLDVAGQYTNTGTPLLTATASTTISCANNSQVTFNGWDTVVDSQGNISIGSSQTFTIPSTGAGVYLITLGMNFDVNSTGVRQLYVFYNSTRYGALVQNATSALEARLSTSAIIKFAGSDSFTVRVSQTSGGALNVGTVSATVPARISIFKLA